MSETAKIELGGKVYEFPVIEGTENEKAIDISKLRQETGYVTPRLWLQKHWCLFKRYNISRW